MNANYVSAPRCECGSQRVEVYDADGRHGRRVRITRCTDCGHHAAEELVPEERLVPGSPAWEEAWTRDPVRLARQLAPEDRANPQLNPLHPNALGWPPTKKHTPRYLFAPGYGPLD